MRAYDCYARKVTHICMDIYEYLKQEREREREREREGKLRFKLVLLLIKSILYIANNFLHVPYITTIISITTIKLLFLRA